MSAKQSEILVERARTRRSIREELRAHCAVFNEDGSGESETAPIGWVEIQRNDTIDDDAGELFERFASDEHAALAVAGVGGCPGSAMHYEMASGTFEPIPLDAMGVHALRWEALNRHARSISVLQGDGEIRWICIVPRAIAKAAGLLR